MSATPDSGHSSVRVGMSEKCQWQTSFQTGNDCGYKQSGWGREMGHDALDLYTQKKAVCAAL
jgi:acyl-CoA reductase-like NAD-dependent aldehyde dehydrogenase